MSSVLVDVVVLELAVLEVEERRVWKRISGV